MKRSTLILLYSAALAQRAFSQSGENETPPVLAASPATNAPADSATRAAPHATSPQTSALVTAGLPKFNSQKSTDPAGKGKSDAATDLRETDKPRNEILRLPNYEVRDRKMPVFKDRELLTREGRIDLALKEHPGLKFGPFAWLNRRRGLEMVAEEEAYQRRREMADLLGFVSETESLRTIESKSDGAKTPPVSVK